MRPEGFNCGRLNCGRLGAWLFMLAVIAEVNPQTVVAQERATLNGHTHVVAGVCFALDGKTVVSGSWDETVRIWDSASGELVRTLSEPTDWIETVAVSADGTRIIAASQRAVHVWDVETGKRLQIFDAHRTLSLSSIRLSADGRLLACGVRDGSVQVFEVGDSQPKWDFKSGNPWTKSLAFSADGQRLAAGDWAGFVRVWDLPDRREVLAFDAHPSAVVAALSFSPNGTELATGGYDSNIKLWDVETGMLKSTLSDHRGLVLSLAYSPNGSVLASGERHGPIKLWSPGVKKPLATFVGHPDPKLGFSVISLAFSPDSQILASSSYDKKVKLWTVPED